MFLQFLYCIRHRIQQVSEQFSHKLFAFFPCYTKLITHQITCFCKSNMCAVSCKNKFVYKKFL